MTTPPTFYNASLVNGWVLFDSANWSQCGYFIDASGAIHLQGLVKNGQIGHTPSAGLIFTLPVAYRPNRRCLFLTNSNRNGGISIEYGRVDVFPDGSVVAIEGANLYFCLDGITFFPQPTHYVSTSELRDGWTNFDNEYTLPGYTLDNEGVVHLQGLIKNGVMGDGGRAFILPPNLCPDRRMLFQVVSNINGDWTVNPGRLDILPNGEVRPLVGGNKYFQLDGISFKRFSTTSMFPPTLTTDWKQFSVAGWTNPGYFKDSNGVVHLQGIVSNGQVGQDKVIFTLPSGYRPQNRALYPVLSNITGGYSMEPARVDIAPDGRVIALVGGNAWFTLDGVSFLANPALEYSSFDSKSINFTKLSPVITYNGTTLTDDSRIGDYYRAFTDTGNTVTIQFMVPYPCRNLESGATGTLIFCLNHCAKWGNAVIDISLNGAVWHNNYSVPYFNFVCQPLNIPYSLLNLTTVNTIVIKRNAASTATAEYWLGDLGFQFMKTKSDGSQVSTFSESYDVSDNQIGILYDNVAFATQPSGMPYLDFTQATNQATINFAIPIEFHDLSTGNVRVMLEHSAAGSGTTSIDMKVNNQTYHSQYAGLSNTFTFDYFDIPFSSLRGVGQLNQFSIQLSAGNYRLSSARVTFMMSLPEVAQANVLTYVKNWIFTHRRNFDEINKIPRNDLSMWQWISSAPGWFYTPWLQGSVPEIIVLLYYHGVNSYSVQKTIRQKINPAARAFHRELNLADPIQLSHKNAVRHAYWMALTTREFTPAFASALGDAHEDGHTDLTIEGPFDHVTDRINNTWGVMIANANASGDLAALIDAAWDSGQLAWSRNFRTVGDAQIADQNWQQSLNNLAQTYNVVPNFSDLDKGTLRRMGVTVPSLPRVHDEL